MDPRLKWLGERDSNRRWRSVKPADRQIGRFVDRILYYRPCGALGILVDSIDLYASDRVPTLGVTSAC